MTSEGGARKFTWWWWWGLWSSSHTPRPISRVSLSGLGGERLGQVMTQAARLSLPHHHHDHVVKIICLALPSRQPPPLLPPPLPPPLLFASLSPSICPVSIICCSRFPWLSLLLPIVLLLLCVCYALLLLTHTRCGTYWEKFITDSGTTLSGEKEQSLVQRPSKCSLLFSAFELWSRAFREVFGSVCWIVLV